MQVPVSEARQYRCPLERECNRRDAESGIADLPFPVVAPCGRVGFAPCDAVVLNGRGAGPHTFRYPSAVSLRYTRLAQYPVPDRSLRLRRVRPLLDVGSQVVGPKDAGSRVVRPKDVGPVKSAPAVGLEADPFLALAAAPGLA